MGATILVVDDNEAVVALLQQVLEGEGYTVIAARNGAEGLAQVVSDSPDLVVMDLKMPGMDGLEMLRLLRGSPATRLLPVIVLTGHTEVSGAVETWMSGAESYLRKPVPSHSLLGEVKRLLSSPQSK